MSWTHIRDTTVKGRKEYRCRVCDEPIKIGESHIARTGVDSSEGFLTVRFHPDCEAYSRTWDEMDWETVAAGEVSREYINQYDQPRANKLATMPTRKPREQIHAPTVETDPVLEAMARKLSGLQSVPPMEQEKMIKTAVKAGKEAIQERIADQIKKDVSEILHQALSGLNDKYLHKPSPHYAPYTKWGTVENDIHGAIDRHFTDQ